MNLLRNILTAIWCAVIIGTNVFALIVTLRVLGGDMWMQPNVMLPVGQMVLLAGFGVMALVSTKYLWVILAIAVLALLLGIAHDILVQRAWRPSGLLGSLFVIVPTYLLARWNTAVGKTTNFNPVKEF